MEEHPESSPRLSRDEMKRFLVRRDAPGLVRFAVQSAMFGSGAIATAVLAADGSRWAFATAVWTGLWLLPFFASMHEAGHGTAFATPWLNEAVVWISAVLMLQSPTFFREFHFEHHRRTSEPDGDPEISGAPDLLAPWPRNPLLYAGRAAGQHLMIGKLLMTLAAAVVPGNAFFERLFPWVRPSLRGRVRAESGIVAVLLAAACWTGRTSIPGFALLLLAWPVCHCALSLFVMPEHTGLPSDGTQLHRTRSIRSNAAVRWIMWNMPYHAEHHAFPAVPFHAAPSLSRHIEPHLEHRARGYLSFHLEGLRRSVLGTATRIG